MTNRFYTNLGYGGSYSGGNITVPGSTGGTAIPGAATQPSVPSLSRAAYDFLFGQATAEGNNLGVSNGPSFETFKIPAEPRAIGWKLSVFDTRGGLNRVQGDYERDYDRAASSTLWTDDYRRLILPPLVSTDASPDPTLGSNPILSYANIFGTTLIGLGSGANISLVKPTSSTDPTLTAVTFTPTAQITCLAPVVLGGAGAAIRALIGYVGANDPQLIGDATGTVAGTLTGSSPPLWGAIQTPLNDNTILLYEGSGASCHLAGLTQSSAITATPKTLLTGVPAGGYALGILSLGGTKLRAWWVWPKGNDATVPIHGSLTAPTPGRVWSTNLEGFDPQPLDMGMEEVYFAFLTRTGIIAGDGKRRVTYHDGRTLRDLGLFRDRSLNSDRELRVRGGWSYGADAYFEINEVASTGGSGNTKRWVERYNFMYGTVSAVSAQTTLSTTGNLSIAAGGGMPVDLNTGNIYSYSDGAWYRQFLPPFGQQLWNFNQTSGAGASTGQQFATTGIWTGPYWNLPGRLSLYPSLITHIVYDGDAQQGGTNTEVAISAGGVTARFNNRGRRQPQMATFEGNDSTFYELQASVTITQGSNTRMTPNALPFTIYGVTWIDELWLPDQPPAPRR